jgi:predicted nucleotidyltransferase
VIHQKKINELEPFRAAIEAVQHLFEKYENRGVIIGGIAVGFLGRPRLTEDVDVLFLLSNKDLPHFLEMAQSEGIEPRRSDAEEFALKNRVLLLRHSPSGINIDISMGALALEKEIVKRGITLTTATLTIRVPTPEDLIIMKAIAHRSKDLEDIRTIIDKNPKLDVRRIKREVKSFAEFLETPGLWEDIAEMFKPKK